MSTRRVSTAAPLGRQAVDNINLAASTDRPVPRVLSLLTVGNQAPEC
jgi:hypothetical protein